MSIAQRIHALLEQDPSAHPSSIATELAPLLLTPPHPLRECQKIAGRQREQS